MVLHHAKLPLVSQKNMAIVTMTSLICRFSCIHLLCNMWLAQSCCVWQYAFWQKYLHMKGERRVSDRGVWRAGGGNIAKQLKLSNMSGCIQNTKNITIKDTAYVIERETEQPWWDILQLNVQTETDKRKILTSGNILKLLQWNLVRSVVCFKGTVHP